MFNDPNVTHEIFSSRVKLPATQYIGHHGRLFYHEDTGELRISDGETPHGFPIFHGGSTLKLYKENGTPSISPSPAANESIALGNGSVAHSTGSLVRSAGVFSHSGDAQIGSYIARAITTDDTPTELFLDGLASRLLIAQNSSMAFKITVMGRRTDSGNEGAVYIYHGGIDRVISTLSTRIIGQVSSIVVSEDSPVWGFTVDANTTLGTLRLMANGENGKTIRWVAHIETVEVKT
jgi:hypothetical protein